MTSQACKALQGLMSSTALVKNADVLALTRTAIKLCVDCGRSDRIRLLGELEAVIGRFALPESHFVLLWSVLEPMLLAGKKDERELAQRMVFGIVRIQHANLTLMRMTLVRFLAASSAESSADELSWRLATLQQLTKDGRDLAYLESDIGQLLRDWVHRCLRSGTEATIQLALLGYVTAVVRYNNVLIEADDVSALVGTVCALANSSPSVPVMAACLEFLDVLVRYGTVPRNCISLYAVSISRVVNIDAFALQAWEVVKNILMSYHGIQAMYALCDIMHEATDETTVSLLRGAVFLVSMASWGSQRIATAHIPFGHVLDAMLAAARLLRGPAYKVVAFEILLSIARLVKKDRKSVV